MTWKLRKAILEDKIKIEELFIKMLQSIYQTEDVSGYEEGYLDKFFDNRDEWICVAEDAGVVIGYLSIEVHHEKEAFIYLDDISVLSEYRNLGIGTELLKTAEQYAKDINIPRIVLHVEKSNESAFRLYERLGYVVKSEEGSRYRMMKDIVIAETKRLYLRKLTLDDVETTFTYASDFENTHYMLMVPFATKEECREFICKCIEEYKREKPEYLSFAVVLDDLHIGEVFAYLSEKEADIGWLINKRYWGNGYATQAANLLVDYLKNELQIEEIVAYCDARNIPSQKVMEHIGMEYVGSNGIRTYDKDVSEYEELKYRKI